MKLIFKNISIYIGCAKDSCLNKKIDLIGLHCGITARVSQLAPVSYNNKCSIAVKMQRHIFLEMITLAQIMKVLSIYTFATCLFS